MRQAQPHSHRGSCAIRQPIILQDATNAWRWLGRPAPTLSAFDVDSHENRDREVRYPVPIHGADAYPGGVMDSARLVILVSPIIPVHCRATKNCGLLSGPSPAGVIVRLVSNIGTVPTTRCREKLAKFNAVRLGDHVKSGPLRRKERGPDLIPVPNVPKV